MEIKQLKYFHAVARTGSFSQAAVTLSVVQPALSRQISRLEEEMGARLFYRNGRGVELTAAGRRLLDTTDEVLGALASVKSEIAGAQTAITGDVTIAMPPSVDGLIGAEVAMRVAAEFPGIRMHVMEGFSGHVAEWLMAGRIDLGVVHQAGTQPAMAAEVLIREPLHLIGQPDPARGLIESDDPRIPVAALNGLPFISHGANHGLRRLTDRILADAGVTVRTVVEIDAIGSIRKLVRQPGFYAILPIGYLDFEIRQGAVKAWRLTDPEVINVMMLAASPNRPFGAAVRKVREIMMQEALRVQL